jgi:NAD(P)-dependent dehydrogenase (short-subunit alcohol dehydrogenase family)
MVVKVLAMEWGPAGIRVNAISPGPIQGTEGVERMAPSDAEKAIWIERNAMRRFGTAEDIANTAIFLSSPNAAYITGAIIDCDGGMRLGDARGDFLTPRKR